MPYDDYWDMIDDYKRYDNQRYERELFEQDQYKQSTEFYDALEARDYDRLNWMFEVPSHSGDLSKKPTSVVEIEQITLETELSRLMGMIEKSNRIPGELHFHWINFLDSITYLDPPEARRHINQFNQVFCQWKQVNRPVEDIWDIGNTKIWLFDCEMEQIQEKVDKIISLLDTD